MSFKNIQPLNHSFIPCHLLRYTHTRTHTRHTASCCAAVTHCFFVIHCARSVVYKQYTDATMIAATQPPIHPHTYTQMTYSRMLTSQFSSVLSSVSFFARLKVVSYIIGIVIVPWEHIFCKSCSYFYIFYFLFLL